MAGYTPSLGRIKEEPRQRPSAYQRPQQQQLQKQQQQQHNSFLRQRGDFDESILLEYAILNDEDLKEAYRSSKNIDDIHNYNNHDHNPVLEDCSSSTENFRYCL